MNQDIYGVKGQEKMKIGFYIMAKTSEIYYTASDLYLGRV
jgi:hypothetical protein